MNTPTAPSPPPRGRSDADVVAALRGGDEAEFRRLVRTYHRGMLAVAMSHVPSRAVAEDVVQETWLAVLEGLDRFEGRSSLRTWVFRILVNRARTRGARERRSTPLSSFATDADTGGHEPAVPPERFLPEGHRWAGHWAVPPPEWSDTVCDELVRHEARDAVARAIAHLPARQREVIVLRDVEEFASEEVCALLDLTDVNQRVLLHRARSKVRAAIAAQFGEGHEA